MAQRESVRTSLRSVCERPEEPKQAVQSSETGQKVFVENRED